MWRVGEFGGLHLNIDSLSCGGLQWSEVNELENVMGQLRDATSKPIASHRRDRK